MTTVSEKITQIVTQRNTLSLINVLISRIDTEQIRLITDNTFDYDMTRLDTIREFLELERDEVQDIINCLLDVGVSGTQCL